MKHKTVVAAFCFGILFACGLASAQKALSDSSAWTEIGKTNSFARTTYLKGYLDGYDDGVEAMTQIDVVQNNPPPSSMAKSIAAPVSRHVDEMTGSGRNSAVTLGQIEDAMSTFYNDYRNAPVCWRDALQFAVWSLNANPATEGDLDLARKRGAESHCQ